MFKNFVIVLLFLSTALFAWLAIRNSTPLQCTDVLQITDNNICLINMHKLSQQDLGKAIEQVKAEQYKYINE